VPGNNLALARGFMRDSPVLLVRVPLNHRLSRTPKRSLVVLACGACLVGSARANSVGRAP
jgi:hypothetical protein